MNQRTEFLLEDLKPQLKQALTPYIDDNFQGKISCDIKETLQHQFSMDELQLSSALLPVAAKFAIAPVSQFHVGAILIDNQDHMYMGANLEIRSEALFHSVHAEQAAISHAWLEGAQSIKSVTISTSPCGHCRQFIQELDRDDNILIHVSNKETQKLSKLMHDPFSPADLDIKEFLLGQPEQQLSLHTEDHLTKETLKQANLSYAPYSKNQAAVAIMTKDQQYFYGRYAENAAFNPSLLPMQCALSALSRSKYKPADIERVLLLESNQGKISLKNASENALKAVTEINLEHVLANQIS